MSYWDEKYGRPIGVLFDVGDERRVAGQLKLKKGGLFDSNVVSIADDGFVHIPNDGSLHGVSEAGRVSLLDCVRGRMLGTTSWGDFKMHHGDVWGANSYFGSRFEALKSISHPTPPLVAAAELALKPTSSVLP